MKVHHRYQAKNYSCGAACFSMLFPQMSEDEARRRCNTTSNGTRLWDVKFALQELGINSYLVHCNLDYGNEATNLISLSHHFPLILGCDIRSRHCQKGRDRVRVHGIVLCEGVVYDPSERSPMPYEAYQSVFNKSMTVKETLIVDVENESYGRQKVS